MKQVISHPTQFAAIAQSARKHRKITQAQMAQVLEASQPAVSRLELNPGNMKLSDFLRICHVLGLEVSLSNKAYLADQDHASTNNG